MARLPSQHEAETTARLELHALERMVAVLCRHTEQLSREISGGGGSRERDLQLQAFEERRTQALRALDAYIEEPYETRIARLEKLVEALACSRSYFNPEETEATRPEWVIRLR